MLAAGVTSSICIRRSSSLFGKALSSPGEGARGTMADEGSVGAGHGQRTQPGGVRGAGAHPMPPAPALGEPRSGLLLPKQARGPRQCPLAQVSKTVSGCPMHSLNKKLTSGKTSLSHHPSAIGMAEK